MFVVHRPAGLRQEEAATAARTPECALLQRTAIHGAAAARARVAVREQRAVDIGDERGTPSTSAAARARGGSRSSVCHAGAPLTIGSATPVTSSSSSTMPSTSIPSRSGRPPRGPAAPPARASRTTPGTTCSCPRGGASLCRPRSRAAPRCRRATPCTAARCRAPAPPAPRSARDTGRGSSAGPRRGCPSTSRHGCPRPPARRSARGRRRTSARPPRSAPRRGCGTPDRRGPPAAP